MSEVMLKTHLIVTDVHEEYKVKWCGSIAHCKPMVKNFAPIFVIVSSVSRIEMNTTDIKRVEEVAKKVTRPRGRQAVTTDVAWIYILEEDGKQKLLGTVTHNHVKQYQQMYDRFEKV
jgi:hypothetical protein